jgi:poly [ADP-ribose] polymerase
MDLEDEDEATPLVSWHKVCFFCADEEWRAKLANVGVKLVKTKTAKTVDAFVVSRGDRRNSRTPDKAVVSLEKLQKLQDPQQLAEAFANEDKFAALSPSDPGDDNAKLLRELWKRAHEPDTKKRALGSVARSDSASSRASADEPENKKVKLVIKGRCAVDPLAGKEYVEGWRVHDPDPKATPYDSVLNLADVSTGTNSYYGLQVLECENSKASRPWALFRKWGRIGSERGGTKVELFAAREDAVSQFESLFEDKTGNSWFENSFGDFQKKPGKFAPVQVARHESEPAKPEDRETLDHGLDPRVAELIAKIFDVKAIEASLREMEIDLQKMPLGNLTKATVEQGYKVLQEIELLLQETLGAADGDKSEKAERVFALLSETLTQTLEVAAELTPESDFERTAGDALRTLNRWLDGRKERVSAAERRTKTKLVGLSNKFYTLIPHDFGDSAPTVISTLDQVKAKTELLDVLAEVEAAVSILKRPGSGASLHPVRARYDELKSRLVPVEPRDSRLELVETLLKNQAGAHRVRLNNVYEVDREGESERFLDLPGKRMLLWHGSRLSNWGGILSRGLLIAPPSAPVSGYRLGKGVYFANVAEKSIGYAAPRSGQTILLLLCEVALGKPAELLRDQYMEKPISGHDSTHALGTLTPSETRRPLEIFGFDVEVPVGKPTHRSVSSSFLHDEFVVYDVRQVRQRYLVELQVL